MPGIFGVIDAPFGRTERAQQELFQMVRRMSAAMLYESFYSQVVLSVPRWPRASVA